MATAKAVRSTQTQPRRWLRRVVALAGLAALLLLAWFWSSLSARSAAATAYGARVACSCRYVAGRPLDQCRDDFISGMWMVMLSQNDAEKSVTATAPLLASQTAQWREGRGCMLESWED